ncbi:MAG: hypothetical protein ABL923_12190 [Burkholderiaceae bacterium]
MNSLTLTSAFAPTRATSSSQIVDPYASEAQTTALLRSGAQYRRDRMDAQDMITTEEAAQLAGTTRVTINAWIKNGRCLGVTHLRRGFKLPKWQFEPALWAAISPISEQLGSTDGWRVLGFLESPLQALNGLTPRASLEQGEALERVLGLASAEAH